jgi:mersacidin/lichenicidin family type 2 lantibiotic
MDYQNTIVRAWKDEDFLSTLSLEEVQELPENPAGLVELTDEELDGASGQGWCPNTCMGESGQTGRG